MKEYVKFISAAISAVFLLNCAVTVAAYDDEPTVIGFSEIAEDEFDPYEPSKKNPLVVYLSENDNGWVIAKWINMPEAVRYTVYIYDEKKEMYCKFESGECRDEWENSVYITDPVPEREYKLLIRMFDKNDNIIFSKKDSVTTRIAQPELTISRSKDGNPIVTWKANSDMPTGYELYVKPEPADDRYCMDYGDGYSDYFIENILESGFFLAAESSRAASGSVTLKKDRDYTVIVRTYYIANGRKEYSNFSSGSNTGDISSYINGIFLEPKYVCSGEEAELVKKYVDSTITADMTNYEKLLAIFELVHSHGNYQDDINKIDGNRPVWQIMKKQEGQCASWAFCLDAMLEYAGFDVKVVRGLRDSGQQHFWCQIEVNGEWYNIDAHVGYCLTGPYKSSYLGYKVVETY